MYEKVSVNYIKSLLLSVVLAGHMYIRNGNERRWRFDIIHSVSVTCFN